MGIISMDFNVPAQL